MLTYNDQIKALFPLSLDGRGARGEGVLAALVLGCVALLMAPSLALAQATCAPLPASGNGTNDVAYDPGTYNPGITCTYLGSDAAVSTGGEITVSTSGGDDSDPLINGINLSATGAGSVTWDSTAGRIIGGDQTNGPVIHATSEDGDIDIAAANNVGAQGNNSAINGEAATVTHGVLAESTAGGSIDISTFRGISASNSSSGIAAIEARTTGGDGSINITAPDPVTLSGSLRGNLYGIRAETSGSGDLTINSAIPVDGSAGGSAGIHATTDTGLLTINVATRLRGGTALRIDTGGDAVINVGRLTGRVEASPVVDLTVSAGTLTEFTHGGLDSLSSDSENQFAIRAEGAGDISIDSGFVEGFVDLSGHTGAFEWNISNTWQSGKSSSFSGGNNTVTIADTGVAILGPSRNFGLAGLETPVVMSFGAGEDIFSNEGTMVFSGGTSLIGQATREYEVRMEGLETFENSGLIMFGAELDSNLSRGTDGRWDDVLLMPGATFIGADGSRLVIDANLNRSQSACDTSLRDTDDFDMPAADCLGIQGGATEGVTRILVNEAFPFDRGGLVDIVVVDVAGGTSGAGHFVLDEETPGYIQAFDGAIDKGIFVYPIAYDANTQQHVLTGVPGQNALQFPRLAQASHDLWRLSTATSLDRQADLRNRGDEDGGLWLRFANETTDGDITDVGRAGTQEWDFDNSFTRDSYAVTFGLDFLSGGSGDSTWVFGAMGGYANSDVDYDASPNRAELNGWSLGAYGGYVAGPLWIDGAVNLNELTLRQHIPSLNLVPPDTKVSNDLRSLGAQVDAGWRFNLTRAIFVEPLASISYVSTSFDTLEIVPDDSSRPGLDLDWDDPTSLRAGLGGRVGTDYDVGFMRGQLSLSAKVWNESDGESVVNIHNNASPDSPDAEVKQTFDDTVTEVTLGASVRSPGNAVSGFVNLGGATSSDYDAFTAKLGVRYQW